MQFVGKTKKLRFLGESKHFNIRLLHQNHIDVIDKRFRLNINRLIDISRVA